MSIFGKIGSALKSVGHTVGSVAKFASPLIGMVNPLAGLAVGAGGGLLKGVTGDKTSLGGAIGSTLGGAAMGGAGGLAKMGLAGKLGSLTQGAGAPGGEGILSKIGGAITQPGMLGGQNGKLDLGKVIGLGAGAANVVGAQKQRGQATQYNNANIDMRNQLMSKILGNPASGIPSPTQQNTLNTGSMGS